MPNHPDEPMLAPVVVIPSYQNAATVAGIAEAVIKDGWRCIVVNDGSTDRTDEALNELKTKHPSSTLELLTHEVNRGKAAALFTGFAHARTLGATHVITLDADGQHDPQQISELWRTAQQHPEALVLGERPAQVEGGTPWRSMFGRRFSNAMIRAQSGVSVNDSQTGFRVYPLSVIEGLSCRFSRFAFETEIVIRAGRAGMQVVGVPIRSRYFPPDERVSHFKPIRDSLHSVAMQAALLSDGQAILRLLKTWFCRQLLYMPLFAFLLVGALRVGMSPEAQWHPAFIVASGVGLVTLAVWRMMRLGYEPVPAATLLFLFVGSAGILSKGTAFHDLIHHNYFSLKEIALHLWIAAVFITLAVFRPAWLLGDGVLRYPAARYHAYGLAACSVAAVLIGLALQPVSAALAGMVPFILVLIAQGIARRKTNAMKTQSQAGAQAQSQTTSGGSPLVADPSLNRYFDSEADRRDRTREMFDAGAAGYDKAEWLTGFGVGPWYRRQILKRLGLTQGMSVLDVAIGTGLVAVQIQKLIQPGGALVGLDPSPGMLAEAKRKMQIETIEGYAESIPLESDRFDVVTMGYALRHVGSLDQAFAEYHRVLKPGGKACIMEIARPNNALARLLAKTYIRGVVPLLARLMGEKKGVGKLWQYYWDTIQTCIDSDAIMTAMRNAGFEAVRCDTTMGVFKEYIGTKPGGADEPDVKSEAG